MITTLTKKPTIKELIIKRQIKQGIDILKFNRTELAKSKVHEAARDLSDIFKNMKR